MHIATYANYIHTLYANQNVLAETFLLFSEKCILCIIMPIFVGSQSFISLPSFTFVEAAVSEIRESNRNKKKRCRHFRGCYVQAEDVSLLERCPHFRGCYVQTSVNEWGGFSITNGYFQFNTFPGHVINPFFHHSYF